MKHLKYAAGYVLGTALGLGIVLLITFVEVRNELRKR